MRSSLKPARVSLRTSCTPGGRLAGSDWPWQVSQGPQEARTRTRQPRAVAHPVLGNKAFVFITFISGVTSFACFKFGRSIASNTTFYYRYVLAGEVLQSRRRFREFLIRPVLGIQDERAPKGNEIPNRGTVQMLGPNASLTAIWQVKCVYATTFVAAAPGPCHPSTRTTR